MTERWYEGLSSRARNAIENAGAERLESAELLTIREWRSRPNVGVKTLVEILSRMESLGRKPRSELMCPGCRRYVEAGAMIVVPKPGVPIELAVREHGREMAYLTGYPVRVKRRLRLEAARLAGRVERWRARTFRGGGPDGEGVTVLPGGPADQLTEEVMRFLRMVSGRA